MEHLGVVGGQRCIVGVACSSGVSDALPKHRLPDISLISVTVPCIPLTSHTIVPTVVLFPADIDTRAFS